MICYNCSAQIDYNFKGSWTFYFCAACGDEIARRANSKRAYPGEPMGLSGAAGQLWTAAFHMVQEKWRPPAAGPRLSELILCYKCACHYIDSCPVHERNALGKPSIGVRQ